MYSVYSEVSYIIFDSPSKLKTGPVYLNTIRLGDMMIKRVYHARYLGLILDEYLSFKEHTDELSKQLNKLANSYKIIRYWVARNNKSNMYFAYTYSKMVYRIEVYENACNEYINKLQVQQNRSLKFLFQKYILWILLTNHFYLLVNKFLARNLGQTKMAFA